MVILADGKTLLCCGGGKSDEGSRRESCWPTRLKTRTARWKSRKKERCRTSGRGRGIDEMDSGDPTAPSSPPAGRKDLAGI